MKQTNLLSSVLLQITLFFCATNMCAQDKEPYAAFNEDQTVLTFYYDELKSERGGMNVSTDYNGDLSEYKPEWIRQSQHPELITKVIFDKSFAACTTLTSTLNWFVLCEGLTEILGIEYLKTDNVTNMSGMFGSCISLISLDLNGFKTDNVTDMSKMFASCRSLKSLDLSHFNTDNVTDMSGMFAGCSSLKSLELSRSFKTDKTTNMSYMFAYCWSLTSLDTSGFNTDNVTDMSSMFTDCWSLTSLDMSGFNTDNVTDMSSMFYRCSGLGNLDLRGFNTGNLTNMRCMFAHCSGLTSLDLSNFRTDKVIDMCGMFSECKCLKNIDLTGFKTDNVTDMVQMFSGCNSLTTLDLSSFNTYKVKDMLDMFENCLSLNTIYAGDGWSISSLYYKPRMFKSCQSLVGGAGTTYEANHVHSDYARIDGGPEAPGYFTYKNPTGIQSVTKNRMTPSVIYDLSGSKLACPQKGINIVDGKKVIVK